DDGKQLSNHFTLSAPPAGSQWPHGLGSAQVRQEVALLRPLAVPYRLLLGPGPSNLSPRVRAAGSQQIVGHMHPEVLQVMEEIKAGIQYAFQTRNRITLAVSGTGHCAMEAALINLLESSDTVLVGNNGIWGERAADVARRLGAKVHELLKPPGEYFTLRDIQEVCATCGAPGLSPTQVLTVLFSPRAWHSTNPQWGCGAELWSPSRHGCLLLVDAVASLGGVPILMDQQGIDVLYTGSQKVLSAPPGISPISFSERAREKMQRRKTRPPSFYLDMSCLASYWGCDGEPRMYHHTGPVSSIFCLREALAGLAELGLESSWKQHQAVCTRLCQGLQDLGLELFVKEEAARLPTVTTVRVPEGYNWKEITAFLMDKHSIEISGGLGPTAGKVLRIGLMGHNATQDNVDRLLQALRDALQHCQHSRL
uniref:Alanine--glyoxylate aminotransferase n=1 Tax=Coturnix japonica TaxID=93934 RepID=A0A8C2SRZ6_COTJA